MALRPTDILAGLSVAGLLVPEAVAYATIAGLPPQHALFAAIAGLAIYALIGRSRFAVTTPTSSSAVILAATVAAFPRADAQTGAAIAFTAVVLAGIVFVLAGATRLGSLSSFVSRPVLRGFAFGLAVIIVFRQLPAFLGIAVAGGDPVSLAIGIAHQYQAWNPAAFACGAAALVVLLSLRHLPALPAAFIVLVCGVAASYLIDFPARGVAVVGAIDIRPELPVVPDLEGREWSRLVQLAVPLALILFAESWGTIRSLALRHGDRVDANRELLAIGAANIVSGLVRGMPVGAGFSASSANEAAGAASRAAGLVAALGVVLLISLGGGQIARLPEPVLAAVVVAAMVHALNPQPLLRLWRIDRDQYVAIGAALAVMVLGVLNGMLIAIALSIAAALRRLGTPVVAELGQLGQTRNFVDLARHSEARVEEAVCIFRPSEPLFFFNAESTLASLSALCAERPSLRVAILSLEDSPDLDSTAIDALIEFDAGFCRDGRQLLLARLKDDARSGLAKAGATSLAGPDRSFWSVWDAYKAALAEVGQGLPRP